MSNRQDTQSKDVFAAFDEDGPEEKGSAMDVDAFTRMLMTGNREPGTESLQEVEPRATRLGQGDETQLPSTRAETKKSKPPPPQHHRGKSLTETKPQDVKSSSLEEAAHKSTAATDPKSARKELPHLPSSTKSSRATSGASTSDNSSLDSRSNNPLERSPSQENRTDELSKSGSNRPRPPAPSARKSNNQIPMYQAEREKPQGNLNQTSGNTGYATSRKAPPPPPSRRQAPKGYAPSEHSSISESASVGSDSTTQKEEFPSLDNRSITAPDVPGSSRSSSMSERNPPAASPPAAVGPPPPPPPRRSRGSSRNSGDMVAPPTPTSIEEKRTSTGMQRSGPESSQRTSGLTQVPEGDDGKEGSSQNVLADLTALQEEVEALRKNYTKAS